MPAQVTSPTFFPMSPHLLTYLDPGHPMPTGRGFAFLFNAFTVFPSFYLRGAHLKFSAYTEMKKIKVPHKPTSEVHHCSQFGDVSFYTSSLSCVHSFIRLLACSMLIEELLCIVDSGNTIVNKADKTFHMELCTQSLFSNKNISTFTVLQSFFFPLNNIR